MDTFLLKIIYYVSKHTLKFNTLRGNIIGEKCFEKLMKKTIAVFTCKVCNGRAIKKKAHDLHCEIMRKLTKILYAPTFIKANRLLKI